MKKKKMFIDEKCKDCPYYYGEIDWCIRNRGTGNVVLENVVQRL